MLQGKMNEQIAAIAEAEGITPERFRAEIVPGYAPMVLRGVARDWSLVRAAAQSDEAATEHLLSFDKGAATEAFVGQPAINGRFFYADDMRVFNFERRKGNLADLLRYLLAIRGRADAPSVYAGAVETSDALPGLAGSNPMPLVEGFGAEPRIWLGNASTVSSHFDASDNVAVVAAGRRRFTLFPPSQVHNLYVGPLDHTMAGQPVSMVELNDPDFERYPRFREALTHAQRAELEPGDAIYIPALWWHQVEARAPFNVLVNYWWDDSPEVMTRFDAMIHAILAISTLPPARREGWRAMFDNFVFQRHGDPAAHLPPEVLGPLAPKTPEIRRWIKSFLMHGLQRP
jgi:hypothetical protein